MIESFRTKTQNVEAIKYTGQNNALIETFVKPRKVDFEPPVVLTLEQIVTDAESDTLRVRRGDWVVRDATGRCAAHDGKAFEGLYEPARMEPLYRVLASRIDARLNCIKNRNEEWKEKHEERIIELLEEHMPHGSGFDGEYITVDWDKSTGEKIILINVDFHHLNENGFYDGWTEHTVTITPSLLFGFTMKISGRDRNDIKDYIYEVIQFALATPVTF